MKFISAIIIYFICMDAQTFAWMLNGRPLGGKVGAPKVPRGIHLPDVQFYEFQKVNHFDGGDFRYWRQRYYMNNATYSSGGPIFLMLGGEAEASPAWIVDGAWQQYARDHGAFLILLEHRYYGANHPVQDISTSNLQYLSSKQALADTAQFITYFKSLYAYTYLNNSSVILFGGSYAGSLAAWTRSRYPYLFDGVVASSAPMVALMEFGQRLCDKINHDALLDLYVFFYSLAENFAAVIQYNHDNREFLGRKGTNITIQTVCDIMTDERRGDNVQRYADVNSLLLDTYGEQCLNIKYNDLANSLKQTHWNSSAAEGSRQWLYQTCSEFGWIQSSYSYKQPFGQALFEWNLTTDLCISVFPPKPFGGGEVINNCDETNRFYSGLNLPISNAVFVNGLMDPWKKVSILEKPASASRNVEIVLIDGTAHCADMYPPSSKDPPQLTAARSIVSKQIGKWLSKK